MTPEEYNLIEEKFKGMTSLMNAQFDNVNDWLERIEEQTKKTNGRVSALENKELLHTTNCPIAPKVRVIEDTLLSQRSIKKFMFVMFTSGILLGGFIVSIIKLFISST